MELFSKYLDQIKAESDLKERTKAFVKVEINKEPLHKAAFFSRMAFTKRRNRTLVYMMAAFAVCIFSGYTFYNHPVNYISLDINPSVELGVNAFNVVIDAKGINQDGKSLIKDNSVTNRGVEEAIEILIQESENQKFILRDGSTVIAIMAISNDENAAIFLKEKCEDAVEQAFESGNINAIVYADYANLELRTMAKDLGISTGKYKMIKILQALDPSITFKQYNSAKITTIITKVNELLLSADKINELVANEYGEILVRIKSTAEKIDEAGINNPATRDVNQNSEVSVKEQNMEQDKVQLQIQNMDDEQSVIPSVSGTGVKSVLVTEAGVTKDFGGNDTGAGGSGGEDSVDKNNSDSGKPQDDSMGPDDKHQEGGKI